MNRAENIPPGFSPAGHVARTAALSVILLTVAGVVARPAPWRAWLLVPVFWIMVCMLAAAYWQARKYGYPRSADGRGPGSRNVP